jgi:drug/metabolite transporter (DMT)-like permease
VTPETLAIALSLASSTAWGVSDFLGGQQSRRIPVLWVVAVSYPSGFLLIAAVALILGGSLPVEEAAIAAGAGACGAAAIALFYASMAIGPVSIVAPIASMGAIIPVAAGLIRGESPSRVQMAGLALSLVGIGLAVREAEHPHQARVSTRALLLAALGGIGFGLFFLGLDGPASEDALWAAAWARVGGTVAIVLVLLSRPPSRGFGIAALPVLLLIGALDAAANSFFALATSKGLLSLVAVGASLFPVVTVLLARMVLSERLARVQQVGVALALCGVALIAAG